jgi:hypothetical protein
MNYKLKEEQLYTIFKRVMEEYSKLQPTERSYDWYISSKNRYVDLNTINFYEDVEMDWEDDTWILQYQEEQGDVSLKFKVPLLRYDSYMLKTVIGMFRDYFKPLLKRWFEETFKLPVDNVYDEGLEGELFF